MKTRILIAIVGLLLGSRSMTATVEINETTFPDEGFRAWLVQNVAGASDGILTDAEIAAVTSLKINQNNYPNKWIRNLKGIEYFVELQNFEGINCEGGGVRVIDVSHNKKLRKISWTGDTNSGATPVEISSFTFGELPLLDSISFSNGVLGVSSVDLSDCPNLKAVWIFSSFRKPSKLISLNLRGCLKLMTVKCNRASLQKLNLDGCDSLQDLDCSDNYLTSLSPLPDNLKVLNCSKNRLKSLDLSKNNKLETLICNSNNIPALTLNCENLNILNCDSNQLASLDLSGCLRLTKLVCSNNLLSRLVFAHNALLRELDCSSNQLDSLDLSGVPSIWKITADNNKLENLDLRNNKEVSKVSCYDNCFMQLNFDYLKYEIDFRGSGNITLPTKYEEVDGTYYHVVTMPENFVDRITYLWGPSGNSTGGYAKPPRKITRVDSLGCVRTCFLLPHFQDWRYFESKFFGYDYSLNDSWKYKKLWVRIFLDFDPAGVARLAVDRQPTSVCYYNLQGQSKATPFDGFNIEVTTYIDGTTTTRKFLH